MRPWRARENAGAELVDVRDRVDELADEMAGVPFEADVLAARGVEESLPHGGLARTYCNSSTEGDTPLAGNARKQPHATVGGGLRDRFPERQHLGHEIFGGINRMAAAFINGAFQSPRRESHRYFLCRGVRQLRWRGATCRARSVWRGSRGLR